MVRFFYNDWFYDKLNENICPVCRFQAEKTIDGKWACLNDECRIHTFDAVPERRVENQQS